MKPIFIIASIAGIAALLSSCSADVERWNVIELPFESSTDYSATGADNVLLDVVFLNEKTSDTLTIPAFWDGGNTFRVRFAPVSVGEWKWKTTCLQDSSLDGISGEFRCGRYRGNLDIYKHGFLKSEAGRKYLAYADGTPFFYLGDTHWNMYCEEFDEPGPNAGDTGAESHFKHIVDRRVEQGFTVYQSEPIGSLFNLSDGKVDADDIPGFQSADRYYQYIAQAGLVHANAELFYASTMNLEFSEQELETMSRYWVARFGAYPVLWTIAQESDNDFYHENGVSVYDASTNPWIKVAEYIHRYDAYSHPLSAHQEVACYTTITGRGTNRDKGYASNNGVSAYADDEVAKRTGHNWWASQWHTSLTTTNRSDIAADYRDSEYPAVTYESRYCYLWTKDFGARAQGWISFLSGFCGYGYGAIDIWLYQSKYDIDKPSFDSVDSISIEDKLTPWCVAVEFESAFQMGYMRDYFESFDWWNLSPILKGEKGFVPEKGAAWACARTSDRAVLYFYNKNSATGTLYGLKPDSSVSISWFNPRTGETTSGGKVKVPDSCSIELPAKPDDQDWVLCCR